MLDFGDRETDHPLGLPGQKPPRAGGGTANTLLAGLTFAVLIAGSALIAMSDDGLRTLSPAVTARLDPDAAAQADPPAEAAPAAASDQPSDDVAPPSGGESGRSEDGSIIVIRDPSTLTRSEMLVHLPHPDLVEESQFGPLPQRSTSGLRPFDAYRGSWSGTRGARIALVIGGLGLSQTGTQAAIETLPSGVTLAFAPLGNSLDRWMKQARREGHELFLQIPMEPFDYPSVDPGRGTLTVDAAPAERRATLYGSLGQMTNYVGLVNYMGARFTADPGAMEALMEELARRGLGYLDDGSSARSLAGQSAERAGVPFAAADVAIDTVRERGAVLKELDQLERIARAEGSAIGIGAAFDITVDAVAAWIGEARQRGVEIVPVSALADDPEKD